MKKLIQGILSEIHEAGHIERETMKEINAAQIQRSQQQLYQRFFEVKKPTSGSQRLTIKIKASGNESLEPKRYLMTHAYWLRFFESIDLQLTPVKAQAPARVKSELKLINPSVQAKDTAPASFLDKLKSGLRKTRGQLTQGLSALFGVQAELNAAFFDELETQLILADVGVTTTADIMAALQAFAKTDAVKASDQGPKLIKQKLKDLLVETLSPNNLQAMTFPQATTSAAHELQMILIVGVNGVGKTTTIGKLAQQAKKAGQSVLLAAGDTFRAAAVEQLQVWGERAGVAVIAQGQGSDSASVIYDALQSAQAKKIDVLIADTAGRLHNKANLMSELQKIVRVVKKLNPAAPHKVLLVVDGCTGQNALSQGREFNAAVPLTGLVVTKLDGTAKGGIVFALSKSLGVPIEYIGIGEGVDDLRVFDAEAYVDALLDFNHD